MARLRIFGLCGVCVALVAGSVIGMAWGQGQTRPIHYDPQDPLPVRPIEPPTAQSIDPLPERPSPVRGPDGNTVLNIGCYHLTSPSSAELKALTDQPMER